MSLGVIGGVLVSFRAAARRAGHSWTAGARGDPHGQVVAVNDREVVEIFALPRVEGEFGEGLSIEAALEVHAVGAVAFSAARTWSGTSSSTREANLPWLSSHSTAGFWLFSVRTT